MTEATIKVSDMVITDEFDTVEEEDTVRKTTEKLLGIPKGVIIVTSGDNKVSGVITSKEILQVVAKGEDPSSVNAREIMDTDIMEVTENEDIENLVEKMKERKPLYFIRICVWLQGMLEVWRKRVGVEPTVEVFSSDHWI